MVVISVFWILCTLIKIRVAIPSQSTTLLPKGKSNAEIVREICGDSLLCFSFLCSVVIDQLAHGSVVHAIL